MKTNSTSLGSTFDYTNDPATAWIREGYQRISPIYDKIESIMEWRFGPWREKLWKLVQGPRVLEVGVGTGKNMKFWPRNTKVTAFDLTSGMLDFALRRANELNREGDDLFLADVQHLDLPSASFNTVVATFVFCSVPDPVQGLREIRRVVRPDGRILLLEHVRIDRPVISPLMDLLAPLVARIYGASINRRTVENVRIAGLQIESVENLDRIGMFKLIVARP